MKSLLVVGRWLLAQTVDYQLIADIKILKQEAGSFKPIDVLTPTTNDQRRLFSTRD
jgi:hypothetical protein